jgi:hypothetical protein
MNWPIEGRIWMGRGAGVGLVLGLAFGNDEEEMDG